MAALWQGPPEDPLQCVPAAGRAESNGVSGFRVPKARMNTSCPISRPERLSWCTTDSRAGKTSLEEIRETENRGPTQTRTGQLVLCWVGLLHLDDWRHTQHQYLERWRLQIDPLHYVLNQPLKAWVRTESKAKVVM